MKKIFMAAIAFTAASVHAAEPIDTLRTYLLQDVQVTSTRANKKTPMAYSDLTKSELKKLNHGQDLPFLLSLSPSVTVTSDAGNGIGYTTIRVRGVDPSRINVTANGIPMNDAESAQLFWVNMGDFASSLQSIQLQRGAGTSTNGAGAFGATLNMQTEHIGNKPFVGVDLSGGSYHSHKETVRFGTGLLGGHWGLQGRLSNIGSKGYLDRASTKLNSYFLQGGYFSDNTMVKFITFNGTERTYHAWNYTSKYEQQKYGRRYNSCGQYIGADGKVHYYDGQTDNYHQQNYQLHWEQLLNDNWNFNVALHYTKGFGYYEEYKAASNWGKYNLTDDWDMTGDLVRQKKMDNHFYGTVASVNYDSKSGLTAHLGGGWNKYDGDHFGKVIWTGSPYHTTTDADGKKIKTYVHVPNTLSPDFEYYNNNAKKVDGNIYGKVNWAFYEGLSAYADLQYRYVSYRMNGLSDDWDWSAMKQINFNLKDNFNFFNPKFGLNYQITDHHRTYVSYAITHKEPTRNIYEDNLGVELKAEKLADLEIGYRYGSEQFSAGANFYYMNYTDQFVLTGELNEIGEMKASNKNAGKSYRMGIELEAAWQPVDWFRWDANATFSQNKAKNWIITLDNGENVNLGDTPTSFSPNVIFNNILTFSYKGFSASVQSRYIGEQYLTNTGFKSYRTKDDNGKDIDVSMMLDDVFTTNLNVSYHFALNRFGLKDAAVGCTVYNLFSAKYDNNGWTAPGYQKDTNGNVVANDAGRGQYMAGFAPSAPVNFMVNLSLNF